MTLNQFIAELQKHQEQFGDIKLEFYSWEWRDDLEDEEYREKNFYKMFARNNTLRIYMD